MVGSIGVSIHSKLIIVLVSIVVVLPDLVVVVVVRRLVVVLQKMVAPAVDSNKKINRLDRKGRV